MKKFFILSLAVLIGLKAGPSALAFSDVNEDSSYIEAIEWLAETGAVSGYEDGTFRPDQKITRAELLKVLVALTQSTHPLAPEEACFTDVEPETWFAPYVCFGKEEGIVSGYEDNRFAPTENVSTVEASKIIVESLEVEVLTETHSDEWYAPYIETLSAKNAYPTEIDYLNQTLTRGMVAEILWRVHENHNTEPSHSWEELAFCQNSEQELPSNVDWERIKDTWIAWTNQTRAEQGLAAYVENAQLNRTATVWAETGKSRGYMDHKRPGTSAYYDYYAIQEWFSDLGLEFSNKNGYTFTENIGRGPYSCSDEDCTDELLEAIYYTYDYFLSEAGKSYRPHWNSIVNSSFKEIGFGITVDSGSYYLTVHYATEISSDPTPICE